MPDQTIPIVPDVPGFSAHANPLPTRPRWSGYVAALAAVGVVHLIVSATHQFIGPATSCIFLAAVLIVTLYGGLGPGILATVLAVLDLDFAFTKPFYSLSLFFDDSLWLSAFFAVAILTSSLQEQRRRAEQSLRVAHHQLQQLLAERTTMLARSEEQFTLLVNGMVDQAVFVLDAHWNIETWNTGAQRLLGYRIPEIIGRHVASICVDLGTASLPDKVLANERYEDHVWMQRSDGRRFWASLMLTPLKDNRANPRGFAVSIRDVTERRTLEQEVVDISEREQQRIGHDLHDGLGQQLTGIAMLATALSEQLETDDKPDPQAAERIADLIHDAISQTRILARGLYPIDLENEGLAYGLQRLSERIDTLPGVESNFESTGSARIDPASAAHLYRIAQEAINNAIRHGKARHIGIELRAVDEETGLTIRDDGAGFDPALESTGLGLRLMRYRVRTIRGALQIQSTPDGGTTVRCTMQRSDHR